MWLFWIILQRKIQKCVSETKFETSRTSIHKTQKPFRSNECGQLWLTKLRADTVDVSRDGARAEENVGGRKDTYL